MNSLFKKLTFLLLSLVLLLPLAGINQQKTYIGSDSQYRSLTLLCREGGVLPPSAYPLSGAQMLLLLDRIDASVLSEASQKAYEGLKADLEGPKVLVSSGTFSFLFDPVIQLGAFGQSGDNPEAEFFVPYRDRLSILDLKGETWFGNNAYLWIDFMEKDPISSAKEGLNHLSTNIECLLSSGTLSQAYQPFSVGASLGNEYLNFQIGRSRLSEGLGFTGNLTTGDNFSMQEYAKASFFSKSFSYSLTLTHFNNQSSETEMKDFAFNGKHQNRVVHRAAIDLYDKFEFAVSLAALFVTDSSLEWRMLIPYMIPHNYNNFSASTVLGAGDEANNYMSVEMSYAFHPGWLGHFQVMMDQVQTSLESGEIPNAFGFLLNVSFTKAIKDAGTLTSYFEAVYTDPFLYLNKKKNSDNSPNYDYDLILGYYFTEGSEMGYTGYQYGPDSICLGLGTEFEAPSWSAGIDATFLMHGEHGINYSGNRKQEFEGDLKRKSPSGTVEYTFQPVFKAEYKPLSDLSFVAKLAPSFRWNYQNKEGEANTNFQFLVGICYKPMTRLLK